MDQPFIELHFGPYESHGIISHKVHRLHGISEQLTMLGYDIEYVPSIHLNRLTVIMKEREIFRCDIRNLLFNMPYMDDKVGHRLVAAVEEARVRMYSELNLPTFGSVKEGMRSLQRERDAEDFQELLVDDTKIVFEIPLHLARNFRLKTKGCIEKEVVEQPQPGDALTESQVDVMGESDAEMQREKGSAESTLSAR